MGKTNMNRILLPALFVICVILLITLPDISAQPDMVNLYLKYKEVNFCLLEQEFDVELKSLSFKGLPGICAFEPLTGFIPIGMNKDDFLPFAWFTHEKKLYIDTNRNFDLSDDSVGPLEGDREGYAQYFYGIRFCLNRGEHRQIPYCIDLDLDKSSSIPRCIIHVRSFFTAKFLHSGKVWDFAVIDNLNGSISTTRYKEQDDYAIIRPVNEGDAEFGISFTPHDDTVKIPINLMLNNMGYSLSYSFDLKTNPADIIVTLKSIPMDTGRLCLSGPPITFLIMDGDTCLIQDNPGDSVAVPPGIYRDHRVILKNEAGASQEWRSLTEQVKIVSGGSDVLRIDPSLYATNSNKSTRNVKLVTSVKKSDRVSSYSRSRGGSRRTSSG